MNTSSVKKKLTLGFSFVEVIVAMGIFVILFAITSPHIFKMKERVDLATVVTTFASDIKQQQIKSMSHLLNQADTNPQQYGVYVEGNKYTLFTGSIYQSNNPLNVSVEIGSPLKFEPIQLPSSQIIFASGSGEFVGFDPNNHSITIKNTITNQSYTIELNQLGIITRILR